MPPVQVRPFRRRDRDQLTALVNVHIDAVLPGVSVPPNAVLGQLEREPGGYVVDPWVVGRSTLVAVLRDRVVGAVHVLTYADDERVGPAYRGSAEIRWLPFWPGQHPTGAAEMAAQWTAALVLVTDLDRWPGRLHLPPDRRDVHLRVVRSARSTGSPGPERWPNAAAALERAGSDPGDRTEVGLVADVAAAARRPYRG